VRKSSRWPVIVLPAVSLTLGLQILRTLWPYLLYQLYGRLGWRPVQIGMVACLIFTTPFLTARLGSWLGLRRSLLLSAGGLGLTRLMMQLWTGDPLVDMALAILGTVCLILFLLAYLAVAQGHRSEGVAAIDCFAGGVLLGLVLDTALHGAFLTYDFIWQAGVLPLFLALILVATQAAALRALLPHTSSSAREGTLLATLPWLAIGPFLFLQTGLLQNLGRLATLTGWTLPVVFGWVLISQILALWLATAWQPHSRVSVTVIGGVLVVTLIPVGSVDPLIVALRLFVGQVATALLITVILRVLAGNVSRPGLKHTSLVYGFGLVLMGILILASYITFLRLSLPFEPNWLFCIAGLVIILSAVVGVTVSINQPTRAKIWLAPTLASLLLCFPLFTLLTWHTPTPTPPVTGAIRVMTYNLHNGFNTKGQSDLEALAQVIEAQRPDIVALQEVARGGVAYGSVDMLSWLSQRLALPGVYTPAGDDLWGQAVLSRYPIISAETHTLPPYNLALRRSFGYLQIDIGQERPLNLINTHYDPRRHDGVTQPAHTQAILEFVTSHESGRFIITGDLNAVPDNPQIQSYFECGFVDVIASAGLMPGYTAHSERPSGRIDYILISSDLTASDVVIPTSTASDHLGVAATIRSD
jgi:endonuclease/exonuclease/phosphatase family metal-dependent hydrolase